MKLTRRHLLLGAGAAAGFEPASRAAEAQAQPRIRLAVSTYSYWHFKPQKYPIESVIEAAAHLGFDGVEILHRQMAEEARPYLNKLKRLAFVHGLDLVMLSIHQDFVSPDAAEREEAVRHTKHCIDLAEALGIPAIRLNSGRWGTIKSFDELMKVKGEEPPLPGYTDDDAFQWCIACIEQCLPHAEKAGVVMALENHWGLTTKPAGLLRIYNAIRSPWLGMNVDTGNSPAIRTHSSNSLRRTPPSCRPKPTTAAASGTRWTWTTSASPPSCARTDSRAGFRWRWKARNRRRQPCPRVSRCYGKRSAERAWASHTAYSITSVAKTGTASISTPVFPSTVKTSSGPPGLSGVISVAFAYLPGNCAVMFSTG